MKTVFVITYDPIGMKNELLKDKIVDFFLACILKYSRLFESTIEGKFLHEYLREEDLIDFVVSFLVKLSERSSDRILIENILRYNKISTSAKKKEILISICTYR